MDLYDSAPSAPRLSQSSHPSTQIPQADFLSASQAREDGQTSQVRIFVVAAAVEKGGIGGFATYQLQGSDAEGEFECKRRYKEFASLRSYMRRKWVGILVPLLPEKRTTGNTDLVFMETRKRMLEVFCQRVAQYPFLYRSEEFQLFLRCKGDFRSELQRLPCPNLFAIRQSYDRCFPATIDRDVSPELSAFALEVAAILGKVRTMKAESSTVSFHASVVIRESAKLAERVQALEQNCLAVLCPGVKTGFFAKEPNPEAQNPFCTLYYWLLKEEAGLMAMHESLLSRNNLMSQWTNLKRSNHDHQGELTGLRAGQKMSLKVILQLKTRAKRIAELESKLKAEENDIQHLEVILQRVDTWLLCSEVPKFKSDRLQSYVDAVRQFCDVLVKEYSELAALYASMASK